MSNREYKIEDSIVIEKGISEVWESLITFSNYRVWNPVVRHAVSYGPPESGTRLKIQIGRWDFEFVITESTPPTGLVLDGKSIGIAIKIICDIAGSEELSTVKMTIRYGGIIPGMFKRKTRREIEESLRIFLTALKRRMASDGSYQVKRDDEKQEGDEESSRPPATPFNLLYKSGRSKSRKRRSGLG